MRIIMYPFPPRHIYNPFINILAEGMRNSGVRILPIEVGGIWFPRAMHVHWLEHVFWGAIARRIPWAAELRSRHLVHIAKGVRRRGGRVVWTMHNLMPHEVPSGIQARVWERMTNEFLPLVTDVVVMSHDAINLLAQAYPQVALARRHVIPIPEFRGFFEQHGLDLSVEPERNTVPTFAMVGMLRPYKGIIEAIEALKSRPAASFKLIIAGDGSDAYAHQIIAAIGEDTRFEFIRREISHAEFARILRRSDIALFNFQKILNSASVISALSCGTPAICPADGALTELSSQTGSDWVRCFDRPLDVDWLLAEASRTGSIDRSAPPIEHLSPRTIGKALLEVYSEGQ